jgi:hypothetical protein
MRPTGSSVLWWHGILIAQPSEKLTTDGLRKSCAFTLKNAPSRSAPGAKSAIAGAVMGTVGLIMASTDRNGVSIV